MCENSDEDHFILVKSGNAAVNAWRKSNPDDKLKLKGYKFSDLDLASTNFSNALLEGAIFERCKLSDSNFSGANLKNTIFRECSLPGANFLDAILFKTNFDSVNLNDANFGDNATISRIGRFSLSDISEPFPQYSLTKVPIWDKFLSWDKLRFMKNINIFVPSYGALVLSVLYLNGYSIYNTFAAKLNAIIVKSPELLGIEALQYAQPGARHIWVLTTFLLLAIAPTLFLLCPSRITDFSREEWESRLRQPLLIYDHSSWSARWLRLTCFSLLALGGLIAAIILTSAITRQVSFIASYAAG